MFRRITIDLDSASVIQDKAITAEMSVHSVLKKLSLGADNVETILIYKEIPVHPDLGEPVTDQRPLSTTSTTRPSTRRRFQVY